MLRVKESGVVIGYIAPGETCNRYPIFLGYGTEMSYTLEVVRAVNGKITVVYGSDPIRVSLQNSSYHRVFSFVARDNPYQPDTDSIIVQ
ncbi:MAG: hypothetical protein WC631_02735 [Candidatus Paceibacterota bacterium]